MINEVQDQVDKFIALFKDRHKTATLKKDGNIIDIFFENPDAYISVNHYNGKWNISRLDGFCFSCHGVPEPDGVMPDIESAIFFIESLL